MSRWSGHPHVWWIFGVAIAIPALVLSVFAVRVIELQKLQRLREIEEQQAQAALLVDAALSHEIGRIGGEGAPALSTEIPFFLTVSGAVLFERERIHISEPGDEPDAARAPGAGTDLVERVETAEAQGRSREAAQLLTSLRGTPELSRWAEFKLARLRSNSRTEWLGGFLSPDDSRAPSGTPVALLAAVEACRSGPQFKEAIATVLAALRANRWWLGLAQRRIYDDQLRTVTGAPPDPILERALDAESAIRTACPLRPEGLSQSFPKSGSRFAIVGSRPVRNGFAGSVVLPGDIPALVERVLRRVGAGVSYDVAVRTKGAVVWGPPGIQATRITPLRALPDAQFLMGPPQVLAAGGVWLWYAAVGILLVTLTLGAILTLRLAHREAKLARLQAEFAAGVTHEFKTPITSIRLLMERVRSRRGLTGETVQTYCATVEREAERLERLVNRLLEAHKIQAGRARYFFAPHSLYEIASTAISHLTAVAEAKQIALELASDDDIREVDVDRTSVQEAIENLIENAIKYSPANSRIHITVNHGDREASVEVRDEGEGIEPADLSRIFDPFYRARSTAGQGAGGTGLGLALVKATAEAHRGTVRVTSSRGRGSIFQFSVPVVREEMPCRES